MNKELYDYMAEDHDRLDILFKHSVENYPEIETELYDEFRKGLLRHISKEERIIFPVLAAQKNENLNAVLARLRLDHGAIAALLVPEPDASVIATLKSILTKHNEFEEQKTGVYEIFMNLAGENSEFLLEQLRNMPEVPLSPLKPAEKVIDAVKRAVERAGHSFVEKEAD